MKWTQFVATAFSGLGFFVNMTHGSVLPYESPVLKVIEDVTKQSADLQDVVKGITSDTLSEDGPKVITGLTDIVKEVQEALKPPTSICVKGPPFTDTADAQPICDAFTEFVKVHQDLLKLIIGKNSVFSGQSTLYDALATALRAIEGVVDDLAFALIGLLPPCRAQLQRDKAAIDGTTADAVAAYPPLPGKTVLVQIFKEYL